MCSWASHLCGHWGLLPLGDLWETCTLCLRTIPLKNRKWVHLATEDPSLIDWGFSPGWEFTYISRLSFAWFKSSSHCFKEKSLHRKRKDSEDIWAEMCAACTGTVNQIEALSYPKLQGVIPTSLLYFPLPWSCSLKIHSQLYFPNSCSGINWVKYFL